MKPTILLTLIFLAVGCSEHKADPVYAVENNRPTLGADKKTITFPTESQGLKQFSSQTVGTKGQFVSVIAPSHVIASIFLKNGTFAKTIFENSQLNEHYYNYAQAVENRKNQERNFMRLQEMAKQQAATVKELKDGEKDLLNSKYSELETENKIKAQGFDPSLLKTFKVDTVLLVSDVPEIQLGHVEMGESVDVYFNSYPQNKFVGKVVSIGEVIDPVSRTLKIVTALANPEGKLRAGMFAKIEFGDFNSNVMSIPISSVFTVDGKNYVFLSKGPGVFYLQEVTLSAYGAEEVGVLSGLSEGDLVVKQGVLLLKRIIFGH